MSDRTAIEWADSTWNSWEGCQKVSPGCDNCYAETRNARFGGGMAVNWGPGAPRRRTSPAYWQKPRRWNRIAFWQCRSCAWRGTEANMLSLDDGFGTWAACPHCHAGAFHRTRQRVFCASLADVFDNAVPREWRDDLATLILATPQLDWLLLTKRVGNAGEMLSEMFPSGVPSHILIGATVVNQKEYDRDISKLLALRGGALRVARIFLSIEPMLGPINLRFRTPAKMLPAESATWGAATLDDWFHVEARVQYQALCDRVDWVIAGGESGPEPRPMHPDWVRSLAQQCAVASVPFTFKQWGEWAPHRAEAGGDEGGDLRRGYVRYLQGDGREPDGHFRRGDAAVARVGKKVAGRLLDGVEHNGYPLCA